MISLTLMGSFVVVVVEMEVGDVGMIVWCCVNQELFFSVENQWYIIKKDPELHII